MRWFKPKIVIEHETLEQMYANSTDEELIVELEDAITLYKKFSLYAVFESHMHFDWHEETVIDRDSIHDTVNELRKRKLDIREHEIREVDKEWLAFIRKNITPEYELVDLYRSDIPKSKWWYWIDQLDELTEEDLKTL